MKIKSKRIRLYWPLFFVKRFCRIKEATRRRMSSEINFDVLRCGFEWLIFNIGVVFEMQVLFFFSHRIEMCIVVGLGDFLAIGVQSHALRRCAMERSRIVNFTWPIEMLWHRECGCIIGFKDSANKIVSHSSVQVFMIRLNWESIIELHFNMTLFRCSMLIVWSLLQLGCHAANQCVYVQMKIQKFFVPPTNIFCVMHANTAIFKICLWARVWQQTPKNSVWYFTHREVVAVANCLHLMMPKFNHNTSHWDNFNQIQSNTSTLEKLDQQQFAKELFSTNYNCEFPFFTSFHMPSIRRQMVDATRINGRQSIYNGHF